jgi:hypothetical protein
MIPSNTSFLPQFSFRLSVCLLLLLTALTGAAQSGRRSTTGSPSIAPPEVKQPEKKPEPKDEKRQEIIVTSNRGDAFTGVPLYYYDTVLRACAGRLDDARAVKVEVVSKHTNRGEAINTAKAQKEAYVVWLQLRTDGVNNNRPTGDLGDISIEYTVYEPTTAKVKAQGTCYQGAARAGGVVLGPRTPGGGNPAIAESRLIDAAQDAAERILRALHLVLPTDLPTH